MYPLAGKLQGITVPVYAAQRAVRACRVSGCAVAGKWCTVVYKCGTGVIKWCAASARHITVYGNGVLFLHRHVSVAHRYTMVLRQRVFAGGRYMLTGLLTNGRLSAGPVHA